MITSGNRRVETTLYILGWCLIIGFMMLDMMRTSSYTSSRLLTPEMFTRLLASAIPILGLFIINNHLLIPRLLLRNRQTLYIVAVLAAILVAWLVQGAVHTPPQGVHPHHFRPPAPRPLFTFPRFLDFIFDILVVGINLAIALMFQRYNTRLELEQRLKGVAEARLNYLCAQINPHFYMNMLNNIHGMIEIDPESAQEMVLDLSRLMRYVLYECAKPLVPLTSELDFISNYVSIMRNRYPEEKVRISLTIPDEEQTAGIEVPPLIFLVFIENAFKHGISYRQHSFVDISIAVEDSHVVFSCKNSHPASAGNKEPGIGLRNARQRLRLIYNHDCKLSISDSSDTYNVSLSLPANEDKNSAD